MSFTLEIRESTGGITIAPVGVLDLDGTRLVLDAVDAVATDPDLTVEITLGGVARSTPDALALLAEQVRSRTDRRIVVAGAAA